MADEKDGGSDILSMVDILEGGKALEDEATAVLGASDDQNCTYPQVFTSLSEIIGISSQHKAKA